MPSCAAESSPAFGKGHALAGLLVGRIEMKSRLLAEQWQSNEEAGSTNPELPEHFALKDALIRLPQGLRRPHRPVMLRAGGHAPQKALLAEVNGGQRRSSG